MKLAKKRVNNSQRKNINQAKNNNKNCLYKDKL